MVKNGVGTLTLSNSLNSYNQGTTINGGTISVSAFGILGTAASSNGLIFNGGTLQITGNTSAGTARAVTLNTNGGTFNVTSGTATVNGVIGGVGSLTKSGAATLIFNGANDYAGSTSITGGVVNIQSATALGTTAGGTSVSSGASLQIQGGITVGAETLSLAGNAPTGTAYQGTDLTGALRNISGTNTYGGAITLAGTTS